MLVFRLSQDGYNILFSLLKSYTRMRAFDFYAGEAQRDARQLNERGRQLEEEARRQLREQRRAARQMNAIASDVPPGHKKFILHNRIINYEWRSNRYLDVY